MLGTAALLGLGLGAAGGALKAKLGADKEGKDRQLAADTQRLAPWTGLQAQMPKHTDVFGDVLQGGMGGLMTGQSAGNSMSGSWKDLFNKQAGPAGLPEGGFGEDKDNASLDYMNTMNQTRK